ncbi:MAG: tRNA epoxyqueuosine(34) reductase QueG [Myxococcota bacterium]
MTDALSDTDGSLEDAVRRVGLALGLDSIGFAPASPGPHNAFVRDWWARGFGGDLDYIGRRLEERVDPRRVLPEARSLIVVALALPTERPLPVPETGPAGKIARYAGGDDYHDVLLERLRALEAALPALAEREVVARSYVDTGPVLERAAAAGAGLGWIGKNTCLIDPDRGSHLMLGVLLTDLALAPDTPEPDHCGTCRACLDACPTDAFPEPYVLDATRCLSYTTIELRGTIPEALRESQGEHVFGCDVCQTVCPWNQSRPRETPADPLGLRSRLAPRSEWQAPTLAWLLELDEAGFRTHAHKTAIKRTGHAGLLRNTLVAAGNSGDPSLRPAVARHLESADPVVAEHARWALERLDAA